MAAAATKTAAHRLSGATLAAVRKAGRENHPCQIKGCKRRTYKGGLCRGHYDLVPLAMRMDCTIECMTAQRKVAARHHRKQLAYVKSLPSSPSTGREPARAGAGALT